MGRFISAKRNTRYSLFSLLQKYRGVCWNNEVLSRFDRDCSLDTNNPLLLLAVRLYIWETYLELSDTCLTTEMPQEVIAFGNSKNIEGNRIGRALVNNNQGGIVMKRVCASIDTQDVRVKFGYGDLRTQITEIGAISVTTVSLIKDYPMYKKKAYPRNSQYASPTGPFSSGVTCYRAISQNTADRTKISLPSTWLDPTCTFQRYQAYRQSEAHPSNQYRPSLTIHR